MIRQIAIIFSTVLMAELGDKTQFAVLLFATRPEVSKVWVALAASLALVTATVIAVIVGDRLAGWISPRYLEGIAGLGFVVIGIFMLVSVFNHST